MVANYEEAFNAVTVLSDKAKEAVEAIDWTLKDSKVNGQDNTVIITQKFIKTNNLGCQSKMNITIGFYGLYNKARFKVEISSDKKGCYCCATHFYSAEATGIESFDYPDELLKPFVEKLKEYQCIKNCS